MNNQDIVVRSFGTILEMLADRGLYTKDVGDAVRMDVRTKGISFDCFEVVLDDIKIIYYIQPKFTLKTLVTALTSAPKGPSDAIPPAERPIKLSIVVLAEDMKDWNLSNINALKQNINFFNIRELQFNVSRHSLVPKHEVVDPALVKGILELHRLKSGLQMPIILRGDAQSRYLGLRNGDVVKITKVSPTSGEYVSYRHCI